MQTDRIFSQRAPGTGEFSFDENVARVFDDMIARSIPLYADVQRSIPVFAAMLDHDPICVIDLGCSTGTSLIHLAKSLPDSNLELVGVDNSEPMLAKFREKLAALEMSGVADVVCSDIQSYDISDASIVLMNYTLQFIEPAERLSMLSRIFAGMRPGGMLFVSEKVSHEQPATDDAMIELYFEFKRRHGYSELEIARKRDSLENVLIPLTAAENIRLLHEAGFGRVELLLKWFNFATFVAFS